MTIYQPDGSQIAGTTTGAAYCLYEAYTRITTSIVQASDWEIVKSALIGATVGFIATTICRLLWENFRAIYSKRFPFLRPKK